MTNIYILQCQKGKYYIGKSSNPDKRIDQHFQGKGSAWTKKYKPIEVIEIIKNCDQWDEDKYTKIYMSKMGINNVRGGTYSQIKLSSFQIEIIKNEIIGATEKCFKCGKEGHYSDQCPDQCSGQKRYKTKKRCSRCRRIGHNIRRCYAKTNQDGQPLSSKIHYPRKYDGPDKPKISQKQ